MLGLGDTPHPRLCLTYLIYGVMANQLMLGGNRPPLIIDIIPCMDRRQGSNCDDFDKTLGNEYIDPILDMAYLIIAYILARYNYVFLDGVTVLNAFLSFIATKAEEWKLVILSNEIIALFDNTFNLARKQTGHHCVHVLLFLNVRTG